MALTITLDSGRDGRAVSGDRQVRRGTITFDSSYPTGGEAVTKANLGLPVSLDDLTVSPAGGYVFEFVKSTGKVKAYWVDTTTDGAPMAEVANTTNLSAVIARFRAEGR